MPVKEFNAEKLMVSIYENRAEMGKAAAAFVAKKIMEAAGQKEQVRVIFASAVSQTEFLAELIKKEDVPWNKIIAFHMDEYHTLPEDAPQRFGNFLKEHLFQFRDFGAVHYMNNNIDDYAKKINESQIDIACLGIGENGHLAFNDPPVADFGDQETTKKVILDDICRQQQVNDGAFEKLEYVPRTAVTLTIPALMKAKVLSVVVPGKSKANAVGKTIFNEVSTECPSTVLRLHPNARLFLDIHSSNKIIEKVK